MAFQCSGNTLQLRTFMYNFNEKEENKHFISDANNKRVCV